MIDLAQRSEPYEIALPYGLSVSVKPLTTAGMTAAQAAARRAVEAIERQARERTEAAGWLLPGAADPRARGPAHHGLDGGRAGRRTGAANAGEHHCGDGAIPGRRTVLAGVHASPGAPQCRKKRLRALCRWHFQPGGGPEYCRACRGDDLPCARGEAGFDGGLCPYHEHALISHQEHEAWDVLLACQGQLRLSPSGHVIGMDMNAALKIAAARGRNLEVSELLPAAEAGLVEAWCAEKGRPD
jgi:hypothetical protein